MLSCCLYDFSLKLHLYYILGPRDHPDIVDSFMQLLAQVCFSFLFIHFLFSLFLFLIQFKPIFSFLLTTFFFLLVEYRVSPSVSVEVENKTFSFSSGFAPSPGQCPPLQGSSPAATPSPCRSWCGALGAAAMVTFG